jgi:hypothetical protein
MLYKEPQTLKIMVEIFKTWRALLGVVLLVFFSTCMTSLVGMHEAHTVIPHCHFLPYRDSPYKRERGEENDSTALG